jgi:hypothetical protein
MKIKLIAFAALLLAGCASDEVSSGSAPIHKGESRAQVEAKFGRPSEVRTSSSGALVCTYSPGASKVMIPVYGLFQEVNGWTEITVKYSHGVVVSWETQRMGV